MSMGQSDLNDSIRRQAEAYIDEAIASQGGAGVSAEAREAAIKKLEAWTRKMEEATRGR